MMLSYAPVFLDSLGLLLLRDDGFCQRTFLDRRKQLYVFSFSAYFMGQISFTDLCMFTHSCISKIKVTWFFRQFFFKFSFTENFCFHVHERHYAPECLTKKNHNFVINATIPTFYKIGSVHLSPLTCTCQ